ncbi:MAG: DNA-processing protein DprA, partial [Clostridia bacterium]|nr:DNA-processing protein DprA [Clostridia bacterium]
MAKISESKILYWLSLSGASVKKQKSLIKSIGSLETIWNNFSKNCNEISTILGNEAYQKLARFHALDYIDKSLLALRDDGILVVTAKNPLYPQKLLQSSVDASLVMYYKGDLSLLNSRIIAIVGTRRCTSYGKYATEEIASTLAKSGEVTVVSGVATGIDTYALESAMNAGGKVIAVLPCGHNKITPT